ncbi:MAG: VOC family protein [Kangiellaceae bacterium]|nr:VOC family protein [Kangiellaceae bacterium]
MQLTPFHLAIQVRSLEEAREFYGELLGFTEGRSSESWIDFDMMGHQLVTHLNPGIGESGKIDLLANQVDGYGVPVPHFGVVLTFRDWQALVSRLDGQIEFLIEPYVRFEGLVGEQGTMFFFDPTGNAIEFKGFKDIKSQLFEK